MKIYAFTGIRFDVADAGQLAAPPFDQINDKLREQLHDRSAHHFSHLTRPAGGDDHELAGRLHEEWLASGVIARDDRPSLYPYSITAASGERRLGVIALVGVDEDSTGDLLPHEHTVDKPLADRLALLEATGVDLEPVFYLAEDPEAELEKALQRDCAGEPLVQHTDAAGNQHVLYSLRDPQRIEEYRNLLAPRRAAIADGHHRTKVAQMFARKHHAPPGTAASAKMAVLTSLASQGLVIDPIHRAVTAPLPVEKLRALAVERTAFAGDDGVQFAAAVKRAEQPAIGVFFRDQSPEVWRLDPEAVPEDTPGRQAGLPVVLLQYQLLAAAGLTLANASDGTLQYRSDPDELYAAMRQGDFPAGFFLPPMTPELFARATEKGDVLPPKSTRFLPKQISGLVWCAHDAELS